MIAARIAASSTELLEVLGKAGVDQDLLAHLRSGKLGILVIGGDDDTASKVVEAAEKAAGHRGRGRPKAIEDEVLDQARELIEGGASIRGAARQLEVDSNTLRRALGEVGVSRGRGALTPDQVQRALELRAAKWTYARIAEELGEAEATVRRTVKREVGTVR